MELNWMMVRRDKSNRWFFCIGRRISWTFPPTSQIVSRDYEDFRRVTCYPFFIRVNVIQPAL
jgi:hypothetical protein